MKALQFPEDYSVGRLLVGRNKSWDHAVEAIGRIEVPETAYVSFWVGNNFTTNLDFCAALKPDGLNGFVLVSSSKFSGSIEAFSHLSNLDSLDLWETDINDDTLKNFVNFPKLRHLSIDNTLITDFGLSCLGKMKSLKNLSMYSNKIGDAGISYLSELALTQLDIGWTNVTDDSITLLKQMKSLKYLRITDTEITESGFLELEENLPGCLIRYQKQIDL